jgi:beta-lactamase regulating signal transducer with metallopeptidase domain/biopolymer transport protein ExbD
MNIADVSLPDVILLAAAGVAAASLVLPAVGLIAVRCLRRRSFPLRHGMLLGTLAVVALLPVLIPWMQSRGLGWDILSERPSSPRTFAPATATFRQGPESSTTLELPTDGSLQGDGMTVAEVMARYGGATAPAARTSTPAAPQQEEAIDVRRLTAAGANILCLAWLAGSCLSLIRALQASRSLGRWMRRAAPVSESDIVELLNACASDAGLARLPGLVHSSEATVPYVSGLWRPRIVLPASLLSGDESTLRGILLHELAHIRRRDLWVGLVQRLVGAAFWWNPLVHRLNARLAEVREDLCDNYVLAHISDPRDYAQTLVDLASQAAAARVVPSMGLLNRSPNRLSGRIQRILQEDRPMATRLGGVSKVLLMVFVFALGVVSTLFVFRASVFPKFDQSVETFLDSEPLPVDAPSEPMISLVRNDAVASNAIPKSANWDVVVFPPVAAPGEAADLKAYAVESAEPVIPGEGALPPSVSDAAPPDAIAEQSAPRIPGPSVYDSGAPPLVTGPPLEPSTTEQTPIPQLEPLTPVSPFASTAPETRPAADDPFSAARGAELPQPSIADNAPLNFTTMPEPAPPPKALVLVELTANDDGSVKQLRYLTEDLGNDDAAYQQLEKQIVAWAGQFTGGDLTVQIVADPQLRYEHVARVTKLCSPLVTRVVLAQAETKEQVTITVGFVRDAQGRPVVATPVVFWQDEVVRLGELKNRLQAWKSEVWPLNPSPDTQPEGTRPKLQDFTVVLRCDSNVEYTVVESIMKEARQAGFEHFKITAIDATETAAGPVQGVVLYVSDEARIVNISIGADDGLRPGLELTVERPPAAEGKPGPVIGRVEVTRVLPDSAECRIVEEDLFQKILIDDMVQSIRSQVAPIVKPDPSRF